MSQLRLPHSKQTGRALGFIRYLAHLLACLSLLSGLAHAQPAPPEENREARKLFQAGVGHFQAGRFAEALGNFEQAYRLKPNATVRVNIANCYDKLKRPVEAIDHFEAFLATTDGTPAQRTEVERALARLSKEVGRLELTVTPALARSSLDDEPEAKRDRRWVTPGEHRLTVNADGYESETRLVEIRAGEVTEATVALVSLTPAPAEPTPIPTMRPALPFVEQAPAAQPQLTPAPRATSDSSARTTRLWLSGGATAVLGITAIVTGQLALAANRDFDTNLSAVRNSQLTEAQRISAWEHGVAASDRAHDFALATDVLLLLTLAGAGLTTYFYLVGKPSGPHANARLAFEAGPAAGRVQLRAQF